MNGSEFNMEMIEDAIHGLQDSGTAGTCPSHQPIAFAMKVLLLGEKARQKEMQNTWKRKVEVIGIAIGTSGLVFSLLSIISSLVK